MYATASELAGYMQRSFDTYETYSATLALTVVSAEFSRVADTWWAVQSTTYETPGTGQRSIVLPFNPVVSVAAVRIDGVAVTDYKLVRQTIYRQAGFGLWYTAFGATGAWFGPPPAEVQIDLTYGYAAPTDDVKGAVLECAAAIYEQPDGTVTAENIDDYAVRYMQLGRKLTPGAQALAELIRGPLVA